MKNKALSEVTQAESLLNNWRYLPGSQVKMLTTHLIKTLDIIASYILDERTMIEKSYLQLSSVRLFSNKKIESTFYDTYFFLKGLMNKEIQRINPQEVKIISRKQDVKANKEYFEKLINNVKLIVDDAFN